MLESGAVGPFFGARTGTAGQGPDPRESGYVPLAEVYAGGDAWARHVDGVARRLDTDERRVAASIAFQGIAARLWSVALGSAALTQAVPDLAPERLYWNPAVAAPGDLWLRLPAQTRPPGTTGGLAVRLRSTVLHGHLLPLEQVVTGLTPLSGALLRGNSASALVGSARVLTGWCRSVGRRGAADRAVALVRDLLAGPLLRGTAASGTWDAYGSGALPFRRRTCCLYYRIPGGGLCGDCVFDRPPGRR